MLDLALIAPSKFRIGNVMPRSYLFSGRRFNSRYFGSYGNRNAWGQNFGGHFARAKRKNGRETLRKRAYCAKKASLFYTLVLSGKLRVSYLAQAEIEHLAPTLCRTRLLARQIVQLKHHSVSGIQSQFGYVVWETKDANPGSF